MKIPRLKQENFVRLKILGFQEKNKILKKFKEQFGIEEIQGVVAQRGKERLFLFQGNFTPNEIKKLEDDVIIERVGIYFAKIIGEEIRLSIEGTFLLKNQITKNIFEISEEFVEDWMKGKDLQLRTGKKGFLIIKYGDDFLGCGKASEEKIGNFVPKSRRLKEGDKY